MNEGIAEQVANRVEKIRNMTGDPESAHIQEKGLWRGVLEMAARGYDVKDAAEEALKTTELNFPRWFA